MSFCLVNKPTTTSLSEGDGIKRNCYNTINIVVRAVL